MKKKILSLCLVIALAATAIIGGTLAYFTDDEQVTNTMTIGNVQINIEEFMKNDEGEWVPFEDDKFTLNPVDNAYAYENIFNKQVKTYNTSTSGNDAYIRTIVLFEKNDLLPADYVNEQNCCPPGLHFAYGSNKDNSAFVKSFDRSQVVNIGGEEYYVVVMSYKNPVAVGESFNSLDGVWMDKNITSDKIAGWGTDGKVDIIVYSQGIQEESLTYEEAMAALGTVDQTNLTKWLDGDDAVINDPVTNN